MTDENGLVLLKAYAQSLGLKLTLINHTIHHPTVWEYWLLFNIHMTILTMTTTKTSVRNSKIQTLKDPVHGRGVHQQHLSCKMCSSNLWQFSCITPYSRLWQDMWDRKIKQNWAGLNTLKAKNTFHIQHVQY